MDDNERNTRPPLPRSIRRNRSRIYAAFVISRSITGDGANRNPALASITRHSPQYHRRGMMDVLTRPSSPCFPNSILLFDSMKFSRLENLLPFAIEEETLRSSQNPSTRFFYQSKFCIRRVDFQIFDQSKLLIHLIFGIFRVSSFEVNREGRELLLNYLNRDRFSQKGAPSRAERRDSSLCFSFFFFPLSVSAFLLLA